MTRLILVRHGESYANRRRIYVGHTDVELEENGFAQARLTAEYIAEHYKVDAVYASDLRRAFCTGKCISDRLGLPITPDRELREIYAGEWENVPFEELAVRHADTYSVWKNDIGHCACPGGETVAELAERADIAKRTFYNHYDDVYAIADEMLHELIGELEELGL